MDALRTRLRRPMTWMVVIEILLVAGLLYAAWRIWDDRQHPPSSAGAPLAAAPANPTPHPGSRHPAVTIPSPPTSPGTTAAGRDPDVMRQQMQLVASRQAAMERIQWQLVDTATRWAVRYLDEVMASSVQAAAPSR